MIIRDTFALAPKLNLKDPLPSDWLALVFANETASVEKGSDGDAVLIMSDRWREAV
jgi:hypothetical protein